MSVPPHHPEAAAAVQPSVQPSSLSAATLDAMSAAQAVASSVSAASSSSSSTTSSISSSISASSAASPDSAAAFADLPVPDMDQATLDLVAGLRPRFVGGPGRPRDRDSDAAGASSRPGKKRRKYSHITPQKPDDDEHWFVPLSSHPAVIHRFGPESTYQLSCSFPQCQKKAAYYCPACSSGDTVVVFCGPRSRRSDGTYSRCFPRIHRIVVPGEQMRMVRQTVRLRSSEHLNASPGSLSPEAPGSSRQSARSGRRGAGSKTSEAAATETVNNQQITSTSSSSRSSSGKPGKDILEGVEDAIASMQHLSPEVRSSKPTSSGGKPKATSSRQLPVPHSRLRPQSNPLHEFSQQDRDSGKKKLLHKPILNSDWSSGLPEIGSRQEEETSGEVEVAAVGRVRKRPEMERSSATPEEGHSRRSRKPHPVSQE